MRNLTPKYIQEVTKGDVLGTLTDEVITAVEMDSRMIQPGGLFLALPGATVDGHDFIPQVAAAGAACVLCSRFVQADVLQIRVPDVLAAMAQIARAYRNQVDIPFVGVTGSVGKTTAKEMIAAVLSARFNTLKNEGNFNNELGVPLTLYRLTGAHEVAVIEMGISEFGEMTRLTDIVHPHIGVFTTIADAHLEFLGDRPGVLRAKSEMVLGMPEDGLIIANGDDPLLRAYDFGRRKILFGMDSGCDVYATDVMAEGSSAMRCVIHAGGMNFPARIPRYGQHLFYAAFLGAAVCMEMGLGADEIISGIANFRTVGHRGRMIDTGFITIMDDCYNANPTSVQSSLDSLTILPGRKVAILGDMMELGAQELAMIRLVCEYAASKGITVIACGKLSRETAAGAGGVWYETREALIEALPQILQAGDSVLVKASHSRGFEHVVEAIEKIK